MTEPTLSSADIAEALHTVFDSQIINYGAYNLVFASGSAIYRNPDISAHQDDEQEHFLIGYRDTPREVVIAPLHLPAIDAAGTPTSIDNTNAIRAYSINEDTFGIESTNGSSFVLSLNPLTPVATLTGSGVLDQANDIDDFQQFLIDSWLDDADFVD